MEFVGNLAGRRVLITGGTGSFGTRAASLLAQHGAGHVRIFSRDEEKQSLMRPRFPDFEFVIGDVRDIDALTRAVRGVDVVFHAAALKQVPSCELFPYEAVRTNTFGAQNLCHAALAVGVERVVGLSTDKAVKPINAMGMSKALMEKIICSQNRTQNDVVFSCVRYGNVVGTRGSVIPHFRRIIRAGKPIPITIPTMTRFLLTLDHAIGLVLRAMTSSKGGEIFVHKAPATTVIDLAHALRRRFSERGDEHPIEIVGARLGEKIHEVLVSEFEHRYATDEGPIFVIHPDYRPPEGGPSKLTEGEVEYTSENTRRLTTDEELLEFINATSYYEDAEFIFR